MKKLFFSAIILMCIAACSKQSATLPVASTVELKPVHVEIHVVILSEEGEEKYDDSSWTYHLSPNWPDAADSATIVNQLIHVNQVENHGAAKDLTNYPYTDYNVFSAHGNSITENPISITSLPNVNPARVINWLTRICDHGYAPHTLVLANTVNTRLKLIYPNL